jgi:hypothetical protein
MQEVGMEFNETTMRSMCGKTDVQFDAWLKNYQVISRTSPSPSSAIISQQEFGFPDAASQGYLEEPAAGVRVEVEEDDELDEDKAWENILSLYQHQTDAKK